MAGYVSQIVHRFQAGDEAWEVTNWNTGWIRIRETRCNGQEVRTEHLSRLTGQF